ncbi:3-hydroxyacyl-CoA dehydrogenase family protein [Chloroflexota bacterium]
MEVKRVGVVGCGQMGGGIVQICAQAGYQVVVSEISEDYLQKGLGNIEKTLAVAVRKSRISEEEKDATLTRIRGTTDTADFGDCDLAIEAAIENLELKKKIFTDLDKKAPAHAILATNSSCLSIMDMAAATGRPERVVGLHFFNPVPLMKLLEVVRTIATSEETLAAAREFGDKVGKKVIVARDMPGFIVNRLLLPQILLAIRMFEDGAATREDIDTGLTLGLNHPMGPLALADLVGLDTVLFIAEGIYRELGDAAYLPPVVLRKMVTAGSLGRKTGKGFYEYGN